jgi:hypothetical protein
LPPGDDDGFSLALSLSISLSLKPLRLPITLALVVSGHLRAVTPIVTHLAAATTATRTRRSLESNLGGLTSVKILEMITELEVEAFGDFIRGVVQLCHHRA